VITRVQLYARVSASRSQRLSREQKRTGTTRKCHVQVTAPPPGALEPLGPDAAGTRLSEQAVLKG
jgi:hypothetical protein